MHDDHSHDHPHGHHHGETTDALRPALARAGAVNLGWSLAQAAAGLALGSTALLSDSVHNLGDAAGLVLAWGAAALAARRASGRRTWGWHRAEHLAGFANALIVVSGAAIAMAGAAWRLFHPVALDGLQVSLWALGGIAVNALSAWWIGGHGHDLNARGAFLHLVSDAAISAAVVGGGLAVHFTGRAWIDPVLALAISSWLLWHTWPFLKETFDTLLDSTPQRYDLEKIESDLSAIEGVEGVHDLHVWPLGGRRAALSVHLVATDSVLPATVLRRALDALHHGHPGIHATIQVEPPGIDDWHGHEICPGREQRAT